MLMLLLRQLQQGLTGDSGDMNQAPQDVSQQLGDAYGLGSDLVNATQLQGIDVSATPPADQQVLTYSQLLNQWQAQASGNGGPATSLQTAYAFPTGAGGAVIIPASGTYLILASGTSSGNVWNGTTFTAYLYIEQNSTEITGSRQTFIIYGPVATPASTSMAVPLACVAVVTAQAGDAISISGGSTPSSLGYDPTAIVCLRIA